MGAKIKSKKRELYLPAWFSPFINIFLVPVPKIGTKFNNSISSNSERKIAIKPIIKIGNNTLLIRITPFIPK